MALARKLLGNCQRLVLVYKYQILEKQDLLENSHIRKGSISVPPIQMQKKKFSQGHLMLGASSFQQATQQGQGPK